MSSWFDRLLEELQRRQAEQDARREGRPFPRGPRPVNGDGGDGGYRPGGDVPPPVRRRPRILTPGGGGRQPRWRLIIGLAIVALFVFGFLGGIVNLLTDLMWFDALGHRDVLLTRLWSQVALFVVGFVAFAVPALASIWLARRIAPQVPIRRLQLLELPDASRAITIGIVVVALFGALISAGAWSSSWQTILLFINGGTFGQVDPNFHRDIGFYVFGLPFWRFLQGWGVASVIGIMLLTLGTYAAGALRWQLRLAAPVRAHVSVLGALLLVLIAAGYQLDMAELSFSTRGLGGTIQAATYTDMHAQVPAYVILTVVALAAAALLLANIWFKTLWLLAIAGAAWIGASILVGGAYPAAIEAFQVQPAQFALEQPYITQNIKATRAAYDLDAVQQRTFTGQQAPSRTLFDQNEATLNNIRLWDYRPLLVTFGQQQKIVRYYDFRDVDIDRYLIAGKERQIMLSARELEVANLADEAKTWTNERLFYTHGFGITAVPVNAVTPEGQPDYLVSGINGTPTLPVGQPRIYFGEATSEYVVTGTRTAEFDYPLSEQGGQTTTSWAGSTGVSIGNPLTRLLFALRFADLNLLISSQLTDSSKILFRREIRGVGAGDRTLPHLRQGPVPGQRRRAPGLDLGRLHHVRPISERPAPGRRCALPRRELRAQQRQGGDRCLRRHGQVLHRRSEGSDPRRLRPHLPGPLPAAELDLGRAEGPPALPRGPVHSPERDLPAVPRGRQPRRGEHGLQQAGPVGIPNAAVRGRRPAAPDRAVLRHHEDPRRAERRVRADPAAGRLRATEHGRLGRRAHGPWGLRPAHRLPLPARLDHLRAGPDPGADQLGQHRQRPVHPLVAGRLVGGARRPAGAAHGRLDPVR